MPTSHFFFIPFVFLIGLIAGYLIAAWRISPIKEINSSVIKYQTKASHLGAALLLFATVFVATHLLSIHGGAKALQAEINQQQLFDQSPASSAGEVYARLEAMGSAGRQAYATFTHAGDLIFPISLFVFLLVLARFAGERITPHMVKRLLFVMLPIIWLLSDGFENAIIYHLISQFPAQNVFLATILGSITKAKLALLLSSVAVPVIFFIVFRNNEPRENV